MNRLLNILKLAAVVAAFLGLAAWLGLLAAIGAAIIGLFLLMAVLVVLGPK